MTNTLARMRQLVGTAAQWAANDLVIGDGELAITRDGASAQVLIGDGVKRFSELTLATLGSISGPGGAAMVGIADAADFFTGTQAEAALAQLGADARGRLRDIRTFAGIVADGVTDDFVALQAAARTARDTGTGLYWPKGVKTFVQFSVTNPQLFVDGAHHWEGADRLTSGILFHCNYEMPAGHAPLFCWGIPSKGVNVNKATGYVRNLGFFMKAGCLRFERLCHIYGAQDFTVAENFADLRAVTWPAADAGHASGWQAGGWWSSNTQPAWATNQTRDQNLRFINNLGYASAEYQNAEAIGITNCHGLLYHGNWLVGWSDDLAAHQCNYVTYQSNHFESVAGRLYCDGCRFVKIIGNECSPVARPIAGGFIGPQRAFILTQMTPTLTDSAGQDVRIEGNSIYLWGGAYAQPAIGAYGVQDALAIVGNVVWNDAASAGTVMILATSLVKAGWTGPAGNPDAATGGTIRQRGTIIRDNICAGPGWVDGEGTISVSFGAGGVAADLLGPIFVRGNVAPRYNMASEAIIFERNYGLAASTDPFLGVSILSLWGSLPANSSWVGLLPAAANINFTNFPQSTPTFYTTLDSEGLKFIAQRAGRVIGAHGQFTANLVAGNNVVLRILKNGVQIGADQDSAVNSPTTNPARYTWNYVNVAGMTFAEGDKVEALVTIRAAQGATTVVGRLTLLCLYH